MDTNRVTIGRDPNPSDQDLLSKVRAAVGKQPVIRALDLDHFTISVKDGQVYLAGHVREKQLIEATVAGMVGDRAMHTELVDDRELAGMLAQALAVDPDTRLYRLRVNVDHGWVRIFGTVPSEAVQAAVEEVVAHHPLVRGTVMLPEVAGKPSEGSRAPVQPPIGAEVIAADGSRGRVKQVIIDPCSRLVTHMIVQIEGQEKPGLPAVNREHAIPVEEIVVVGYETIYLRRDRLPLSAYPVFSDDDFALPRPAWTPPYPYTRGTVRWLRRVRREPERQLKAQALEHLHRGKVHVDAQV